MNIALFKEIESFSKSMSDKYKCNVVLIPMVNKISLIDLYDIVDSEFVRYNKWLPKPLRSEDIKSKSRKVEFVLFRQIFIHISREMEYSLSKIGKLVDRHHSTILHNLEESSVKINNNSQFIRYYNIIKTKLAYASAN